MKLITLNSHSLIEENYEEKFHRFIQGILTERPDILALQEVNQNMAETEADPEELRGNELLSLPLLHPCPPGQPRPSLRERAGPSWISRTLDMDFR